MENSSCTSRMFFLNTLAKKVIGTRDIFIPSKVINKLLTDPSDECGPGNYVPVAKSKHLPSSNERQATPLLGCGPLLVGK